MVFAKEQTPDALEKIEEKEVSLYTGSALKLVPRKSELFHEQNVSLSSNWSH